MTTDYLPLKDYNRLFPFLSYDNYLALRLSLETGIRIGDVVSLPAAALSGNKINFTAAKSGKAGCAIISKDLADKLKRYSGKTYIFSSSSKAGHRTRQAVWKDVKKAAAAAGITKNIAPHSARKTYAVQSFQRHGLKETQRRLQHDNSTVTAGYVLSGVLTEAQEKAGFYLDEAIIDDLSSRIAQKVIEGLKKERII